MNTRKFKDIVAQKIMFMLCIFALSITFLIIFGLYYRSRPILADLYPHLTPLVSGCGARWQEGVGIKLPYTRKRYLFENGVHFNNGVQAL